MESHPGRPRDELTRRDVIRTALAATGAWSLSSILPRPVEAAPSPLPPGSVILFQGDSITDAGRNRRSTAPNDSGGFGRGYPFLLAAYLLGMRPEQKLKLYNRGISGHKVPDLQARWKADTIDLKPDILSILIGVNDIWHKLNGRYDGTVETYETGFAKLLADTRAALPETRIVVCEPFVLRCGAVKDNWFPEFDQRRAAAKRVADGAGATWVPFQTMFDEAVKKAEPAYWARDGVHPTMAGHALMANTWLGTVRP